MEASLLISPFGFFRAVISTEHSGIHGAATADESENSSAAESKLLFQFLDIFADQLAAAGTGSNRS